MISYGIDGVFGVDRQVIVDLGRHARADHDGVRAFAEIDHDSAARHHETPLREASTSLHTSSLDASSTSTVASAIDS
jgi:hypothetical protein